LGRKLVEHLDRDCRDVLVSWMSHHVARLIAEARDAAPEQKAEAEEHCRRAILDLWRERRSLNAPPPLASVDRIEEAIGLLRDSASGWYLKRLDEREALGDGALRAALLVDNAAKQIIRWCICEALGHNLAEDARWLAWVDSPLFSGERDLELARSLVADYMLLSAPQEPNSEGARERGQILKYMKGIAELAAQLAADIEQQEREAAASPGEPADGGSQAG
jgi:cytochrome P450